MCPGADDNASGVACMLEVARALARAPLACRVRAVAFVNEEPPHYETDEMGSRVYARMARERNDPIEAMISLECLGSYADEPGSQRYPPIFSLFYPDRGNFVGVVGNIANRALVVETTRLMRAATDVPVECAATWEGFTGVAWSDHASFWREGYRAVMLTDTALFRSRRYHTAADTADSLDYPRFARVTAGVIAMVRGLARKR
jgi:Zn-dependent M28 family amino/carboxypeptidase